MRVVLTVAISDSSGGAGIQGDIKALQVHGTYGASVIVALAAENTVNIQRSLVVPADYVTSQFDAVCADIGVDAVKVGGLPSAAHVRAVADGLQRFGLKNIVLHPAVMGNNGDRITGEDAIAPMRRDLFPLACCICLNRLEVGAFFGAPPVLDDTEAVLAARQLIAEGAGAVLLTAGYGDGVQATDFLVTETSLRPFSDMRSRARSMHGSGCALSSVIAAGLAHGLALEDAIAAGKSYVTAAINAGSFLHIGQGTGPIDHSVAQPDAPGSFRSRAVPRRIETPDAF